MFTRKLGPLLQENLLIALIEATVDFQLIANPPPGASEAKFKGHDWGIKSTLA
jgi:hypothetical protein